MKFGRRILKSARNVLGIVLILAAALSAGYMIWTPGRMVVDGSHDRETNGLWMQHGWLGHDDWFQRYNKNPALFRSRDRLIRLKNLLAAHHVRYLYPHLAPCRNTGEIAPADPAQAELFLGMLNEFHVLPWVGGVLDKHVILASPQWRAGFIRSIAELLRNHPRLRGVHVNIEPLPSGNSAYIDLLKQLKAALPDNKMLSIAAYPPPTWFQPFSEVHWDRDYYRQAAANVDQLVVMMYDTGLRFEKLYQRLMSAWTREVLAWSAPADVLLGIPAYEDAGVPYHHPRVENLRNSLRGIHAGLGGTLPANYRGIALYSDWEMDRREWDFLKKYFLRKNGR